SKSIFLGTDFLWMIPAANVAYCLLIGAALLVLNRRWPWLISTNVAIFVCAFLAVASLLLRTGRVEIYAAVLLAAGVAFQASRLAAAHPEAFNTLVQRSLAWPMLLIRRTNLGPQRQRSPRFDPKRRELLAGSAAVMAGL